MEGIYGFRIPLMHGMENNDNTSSNVNTTPGGQDVAPLQSPRTTASPSASNINTNLNQCNIFQTLFMNTPTTVNANTSLVYLFQQICSR